MALAPLSVASVSPSPYPLSLFILSSILSVCLLLLVYTMLARSRPLLFYLLFSSVLQSHFLSSFLIYIPSLYSCPFLLHTLFFVLHSISARSERGRKKEYLIVPCFLSHKLTLSSLVVNIWQPRNYGFSVKCKMRVSMRILAKGFTYD